MCFLISHCMHIAVKLEASNHESNQDFRFFLEGKTQSEILLQVTKRYIVIRDFCFNFFLLFYIILLLLYYFIVLYYFASLSPSLPLSLSLSLSLSKSNITKSKAGQFYIERKNL